MGILGTTFLLDQIEMNRWYVKLAVMFVYFTGSFQGEWGSPWHRLHSGHCEKNQAFDQAESGSRVDVGVMNATNQNFSHYVPFPDAVVSHKVIPF